MLEANWQPVLEDDLVVLKPLRPSDFKALFRAASDPLIWEQHQDKKRWTEAGFTAFFDGAMSSKMAFAIMDKQNNQVVGSSRYKLIDPVEGIIEIGWTFLERSYWGGKYNKAIKKLMIEYALKTANKVVFYVDQKNYRSQQALVKIGARKVSDSNCAWVLPEQKGLTYVLDKPMP